MLPPVMTRPLLEVVQSRGQCTLCWYIGCSLRPWRPTSRGAAGWLSSSSACAAVASSSSGPETADSSGTGTLPASVVLPPILLTLRAPACGAAALFAAAATVGLLAAVLGLPPAGPDLLAAAVCLLTAVVAFVGLGPAAGLVAEAVPGRLGMRELASSSRFALMARSPFTSACSKRATSFQSFKDPEHQTAKTAGNAV